MKNAFLYLTIIGLHLAVMLPAQRVMYSSNIRNHSSTTFDVIGKAGDHYWIQKNKSRSLPNKPGESWMESKERSFEVYDARLNLVHTIHVSLPDFSFKEYYVAGKEFFDQLVLIHADDKTLALINRYSGAGENICNSDTVGSFPGFMKASDFLLVRSQDKSRLLLLGFETVPDSLPRVHAFLYDKNWKTVYHSIYKNNNILQPFLQYDIIEYPLEHFTGSPIKLSNNGEWIMVSPSATSHNYSLFHFRGTDKQFFLKDIRLPIKPRIEELALFLDNEKREAMVGILLNTRYSSVKNARVAHYLLSHCRFDFDTSYRFNTLAFNKTTHENLFEQYFMVVPGKGFMLLKEYGRPWTEKYPKEIISKQEDDEDSSIFAGHDTPTPVNKNEYTKFNSLAGTRNKFDRGDLSLYYFPALPKDSCWSGIINKAQVNELNSSYLSYVFMPVQNKLIFLYNSVFYNMDKYSSSTILDDKGNSLNEGLVFWRSDHKLDFQKARQISATELAIPYERNMRTGFVIVKL